MGQDQGFLVLILIGYAFAAKTIKAKVGDRIVLDPGPGVFRWQRERINRMEEMMMRCEHGDKRAICQGFIKMNGEPATPPSYVLIDGGGRLIINPVVETDSGTYLAENEFLLINGNEGYLSSKKFSLTVTE
uniref:Putative IQ calmodulin-binding motif domain protein n=1 Tax=Angiostrongylus cantonensis TaxID=6313 RepID=A0A0K0DBF7_ANGCA